MEYDAHTWGKRENRRSPRENDNRLYGKADCASGITEVTFDKPHVSGTGTRQTPIPCVILCLRLLNRDRVSAAA